MRNKQAQRHRDAAAAMDPRWFMNIDRSAPVLLSEIRPERPDRPSALLRLRAALIRLITG